MTTAIEVTKREMYSVLERVKRMIFDGCLPRRVFPMFEEAIEAHLEALRQDRAALTTERDTLRNRVQVLEMANATSGEVIRSLKDEAKEARKASMKARLAEFATPVSNSAENVASAPLDANTAIILGALVDAQRIMTDYLVPDGIRAKDAMGKIIPVLDNEKLCLAMDAFEKPKPEISGKSLEAQYFANRTMASVALDKMVKDLMIHGTGAIWMTPSDDGIEVSNQPAEEMFKQSGCMHSFHPSFPSGELCTFCGVGK